MTPAEAMRHGVSAEAVILAALAHLPPAVAKAAAYRAASTLARQEQDAAHGRQA